MISRQSSMCIAAWILSFAGLFAFYMLWRPLGIHVSDSYAYTNTVDTESFYYFFHPHHLLYLPLAWRWTGLVRLFVPEVSTWVAMVALSAAFGCAGVAGVYCILRRLGAASACAAAGAALQSVLFGYWFFSSEPEVYTLSASCAVWSLYYLVRLYDGREVMNAVWAGVAAGFAALFHQTGIFLFAPALLIMILKRRAIIKSAAAFTAAFGVVVAPVYLLACWASEGTAAPGVFLRWIFLFGTEGYGGLEADSAVKAAVGSLRGLVGGQAVLDLLRGGNARPLAVGAGILLAAGGLGALGMLAATGINRIRHVRPRATHMAAACLVTFGVYAAFSIYFDPANFEWWVLPWCFGMLAISTVALTGPRPAARLAWAAVVMVAGANLLVDFSHRRQDDTDVVANAARGIAAATSPQDLIVVPSFLGSVLWYENRDRVVYCPDKSVRQLGRMGAAAVFDGLITQAAARTGRIVIAGTGIEEEVDDLFYTMEAVGRQGREIGRIFFFGAQGWPVRRLEKVPVVAFDPVLAALPCRDDARLASLQERP